ncbi:phospholipase [Lacticaseibacillus paracasei]|nr:phospholipase [Lacticaseibacillus paracasei]
MLHLNCKLGEINKWARSLKNDGPEKGMLLSMARFNLLVYGNYCGKGNNGKAPIDYLDGACQAHDTCYAWGGNNEKCNQEFRQRLLTIMQKTSLFDYKHIVAVAAYKLFGG